MKKTTLLLITVFLLATTPAFAHCGTCGIGEGKGSKGSGSEDWVQKKTEKMTEKLGLSEEQAADLKSLLEAKKAAKMKMKEDFRSGLDAILTDEQKAKKEAMMKEKGSKKGSDKGEMKGSDHDHEEERGSKKGS